MRKQARTGSGALTAGFRPERGEAGSQGILSLAEGARRRGLAGPAAFLLEVALPLHSLIQQLLFAGDPLLRPWLGDRLLLWADQLEDTAALEGALAQLAAGGGPGPASRDPKP